MSTSKRTPQLKSAPVVLPAWASEAGWESDVVISTRARLARNVRGVPFPGRASPADLRAVVDAVDIVLKSPGKELAGLRPVDIDRLDPPQRSVLVDSHLISVQHATSGPSRRALVDDRHTVSVMVNEEDHLRIQAILPGHQIPRAWQIADALDDAFGEFLDYARHPRHGYLTASLSNCGTGLRASVMAHLPGIALVGRLEESLTAAQTLGTSIRGSFGENTGMAGDVFQLSNAVSIGLTENQIISRLGAVVTYLVTDELAARELLWRTRPEIVEARVADAKARLKASTRLSSSEAMSILSTLRLAHHFGMPGGVSPVVFNELLASMRLGAQFVLGRKAHYTFYEETRRPALIRNKIRNSGAS